MQSAWKSGSYSLVDLHLSIFSAPSLYSHKKKTLTKVESLFKQTNKRKRKDETKVSEVVEVLIEKVDLDFMKVERPLVSRTLDPESD
jgi:hypothetical protein